MQCFPYCVTYCFQRKRKLSSGNFTCSCCSSPDGVHGVRNNAVFPIRMTSIIVWPLFYVTIVISKFPSARLRYETSTHNEQHALLHVARFCMHNAHILSLYFKYGVYKPNMQYCLLTLVDFRLTAYRKSGDRCSKRHRTIRSQ